MATRAGRRQPCPRCATSPTWRDDEVMCRVVPTTRRVIPVESRTQSHVRMQRICEFPTKDVTATTHEQVVITALVRLIGDIKSRLRNGGVRNEWWISSVLVWCDGIGPRIPGVRAKHRHDHRACHRKTNATPAEQRSG